MSTTSCSEPTPFDRHSVPEATPVGTRPAAAEWIESSWRRSFNASSARIVLPVEYVFVHCRYFKCVSAFVTAGSSLGTPDFDIV